MSLTSGLFNKRISFASRKIGAFSFDIVTNEDHVSTMRVTKNPVETGADITDHAIVEGKKLSVRGIMTSFEPYNVLPDEVDNVVQMSKELPIPYGYIAPVEQSIAKVNQWVGMGRSILQGINGFAEFFSPNGVDFINDLSSSSDRVPQAQASLLKIQHDRSPIDVVTGIGRYRMMMLTSITTSQDSDGSAVYDLEFEEVRFADSKVGVGSAIGRVKNQLSSTVNSGSQKVKDISILKGMF